MARINLLPWREELRAQRQKNFAIGAGVSVVFAVALIFLADTVISSQIASQKARNQFVKKEIASLEGQIREINSLKKKKKELLERMRVIQNLQGNRPVIVRVFDEIVQVLPDGVYFTTLKMEGDVVHIKGIAASNNKIARLMRQLDDSQWFEDPNLTAVKADKKGSGSVFDLTVKQAAPSLEDEA